jgi:hypothetical protein
MALALKLLTMLCMVVWSKAVYLSNCIASICSSSVGVVHVAVNHLVKEACKDMAFKVTAEVRWDLVL